MVTGPRACGKTTTARRHAQSIVRLDVPAEAEAFAADPDAALRAFHTPVLLDEWQSVPNVLGAVKRAVDEGAAAGSFLLTGSVRAQVAGTTSWAATGRIVEVRMHGLTQRELAGGLAGEQSELRGELAGEPFLSRLAGAEIEAFAAPSDPPDLLGYVELALRGGFPDTALAESDTARQAWLEGYLSQLLTRDAHMLDGPRDPLRLRRYFEALALNSAGTVEHKTLYDAAQLDRKTALAYDRLLENLLVVDVLPAWSSNRLSRLAKMGKRYLVDAALMGAALRLDETAVLRDGDLLGRMIDTFTVAQIRAESELEVFRPRLHHLRTRDGRHEIDLVAEMSAGSVVAIEIKASAAPKRADARHLEWLRDSLSEHFLAGAVLHTGPRPFALSERIFALPIATLWA